MYRQLFDSFNILLKFSEIRLRIYFLRGALDVKLVAVQGLLNTLNRATWCISRTVP